MGKSLHKRYEILNGEEVFRYYFVTMGAARSITKLNKYLVSTGKYNPRTGTISRMAATFSMWRWAAENSDKAYEIFNTGMRDSGEFWSREDWDTFLLHKMMMIVKNSPKRLERWQKRIQQRRQMTFA